MWIGLSDETIESMAKGARKTKQKDTIKIRYAYIASSKDIPVYRETLKFKVLSLEQLETQLGNNTIQELIADNTSPISIKGRDIYTRCKDMDGKEIFENDIVCGYPSRTKNFSDAIVTFERGMFSFGEWYENDHPATEEMCKVIGNTYEDPNYTIT